MKDWNVRKILIIGAARQGLALARFLASKGAHVTLNDIRSPDQMQPAQNALQEYPINWQLGHHSPRLLQQADQVFISGGIPLTLPLIREAVQKGIPLSNDSQIFMEVVPCKVIGITGSAGKTTTTTLVGRMAEHAARAPKKAWIGGNIGNPLIGIVDQISPEDIVVLEFSSFQLELMDRSPQISAILNITPNHLDRHGTMSAYTAIKSKIFKFQEKADWTILGYEDPIAWQLRNKVPGNLAAFGFDIPQTVPGATMQDNIITIFDGEKTQDVMPASEVLLRGRHNLLNVMAACSIAQTAGFPVEAMQAGVSGFGGVQHRLEFVRTFRGADWYNDSKATTPEGAAASIEAFDEPKIVLLGGRDKNLPWDRLSTLVFQKVDHIIAFGEAADIILETFQKTKENGLEKGEKTTTERCTSLYDAVTRASEIAEPGDVVLLSPGGTSFDEFNNYEERGERYKEWVNKLT